MMRLLMVTREQGTDKRYGLGKSLIPLIEGLTAKGHQVMYLTGDQAGERGKRWLTRLYRFSGVFSHRPSDLLWALLERLNMGRLAANLAVQERYTHVHLHDPWIALGYYLFSRLSFNRYYSRWGITEHGFGCYAQATLEDGLAQTPLQHKLLRWLEKWLIRRSDWLIAPTHAALQQLARDLLFPVIPDHWHVLPHPLPTISRFPRQQARERLGWNETDCYLLAVGRLATLKRFDLLIQACAKLTAHRPVQLVILGEGDSAGLYDLARQKGIRDRLTITTSDDVGIYLSAADIYISSSSTEAFGYANLEALLAGLPCICTAVGGVPEVVGLGAWLVACQQTDLQPAIDYLLDHPERCTELSQQAARRINHWQSLTTIVEQYEQLVG